jgi:hypothetical protein
MNNLIKIHGMKKIQGGKFLFAESCISSSKFFSFDRLIVGSKERVKTSSGCSSEEIVRRLVAGR